MTTLVTNAALIDDRPVRAADPITPPGRGTIAHVLRAAVLAILLVSALGAPGAVNDTAPTEDPTSAPVSSLLEVPTAPKQILPAIAPEQAPVAPRRAQVAPQAVTPAEAAPSAPQGGGDTSVAVQNGSNDVQTESGGAHVNNDANLHTSAGVDNGEEPEEPQP
jgi:hypothetical protein